MSILSRAKAFRRSAPQPTPMRADAICSMISSRVSQPIPRSPAPKQGMEVPTPAGGWLGCVPGCLTTYQQRLPPPSSSPPVPLPCSPHCLAVLPRPDCQH